MLISTIYYIAGFQALLLALVFFQKKGHLFSNRIQMFWLLLLAADLVFQGVGANHELFLKYVKFLLIFSGLPLVHGPFLYLYVKSLTTQIRFKKTDYLHFFMFFLLKIIMMPYLFLPAGELRDLIIRTFENRPSEFVLIDHLIAAHGMVYTILAYRLIRQHRDHVKEYYSDDVRYTARWLSTFTFMNILIWFSVMIFQFVPIEILRSGIGHITYLLVSVLIFIIAYYALNHPVVFAEQWAQLHPPETRIEEKESGGKYAKTALKKEKIDEIKISLLKYMEDKPWLEPELSILDISVAIGYPIYQISQVINDQFETNLYTFINRYRVDEVKAALVNPELTDYPILQIAFMSGFNSKSTFNSVFKELTGSTPTEFRRSTTPLTA